MAIENSLQGLKRIASITSSLKNYVYPEENRPIFFNVNTVIEEAITISRNEWKYVSDLSFEKNESLPTLQGYPSEIHQVLINLIVNASHAIDEMRKSGKYEKGHISIKLLKKDHCLQLEIKDNGIGIPQENQDKIFNPFFTTKERGKGSGQGLSISKDIIEQRHNGSISVKSKLNKGTTFIISFKLKDGEKS